MMTDVVNYTWKMSQNEETTMEMIAVKKQLMYPMIERFGGSVVKTMGDGLLVVFASGVNACRCAIHIQE